MSKPETSTVALTRPANTSIGDHANGSVRPYELDPELAQLKMAELMVAKLGTPSVLDKEFAVRFGIFTALNHNPYMNRTGYDSSLRTAIYKEYAAQSVNQDGLYFRNFWAYMMKPKYIIQGNMANGQPLEEEKESIAGRFVKWLRGGKKNEQSNTQ